MQLVKPALAKSETSEEISFDTQLQFSKLETESKTYFKKVDALITKCKRIDTMSSELNILNRDFPTF